MGYRQEPAYSRFKGVCRDCGADVVYSNSVKMHPDLVRCDSCEKAWIAERLTGQKIIDCPVAGQG